MIANENSTGSAWLRELAMVAVVAALGLLLGSMLPGAADEPAAPQQAVAQPEVMATPLTAAAAAPTGPTAPEESCGHRGIGKTGTPPDGAAVFPDGTWLEPLNGVAKAPPFPGFGEGDFKPVVRIETNAQSGLQWYIHEDNYVSTTQIVTHRAGDKTWTSPEWVVGRPVPTKPVR